MSNGSREKAQSTGASISISYGTLGFSQADKCGVCVWSQPAAIRILNLEFKIHDHEFKIQNYVRVYYHKLHKIAETAQTRNDCMC